MERIGCFSVESKRLLEHQDPSSETVMTCSSVALSSGLKVFAVRNGSKCLGDEHLASVLSQVNGSKGCVGGRGGQNVSDVYRLTSKKKRAFLFHLVFRFVTFSSENWFTTSWKLADGKLSLFVGASIYTIIQSLFAPFRFLIIYYVSISEKFQNPHTGEPL